MSKIDLSIIIVNYRCWEVLAKCIESFNKYKPDTSYEIIVVDNDSQDNQFNNFKQQFHEIKLIANKGNYGFSNGCNLGADNANGEFLLFLNPDITLTNSPAIDDMFSFARCIARVLKSYIEDGTTRFVLFKPTTIYGEILPIQAVTFITKGEGKSNQLIYGDNWKDAYSFFYNNIFMNGFEQAL